MGICKLLFRGNTSRWIRLLAVTNVCACAFVVFMTMLTSFVGYFIIVPVVYGGQGSEGTAIYHRTAILYLFVNVCGNFILCLCVDTSTARAARGVKKRKPTPNNNPLPSKIKAEGKSESTSKTVDSVGNIVDNTQNKSEQNLNSNCGIEEEKVTSDDDNNFSSTSNQSRKDCDDSTPDIVTEDCVDDKGFVHIQSGVKHRKKPNKSSVLTTKISGAPELENANADAQKDASKFQSKHVNKKRSSSDANVKSEKITVPKAEKSASNSENSKGSGDSSADGPKVEPSADAPVRSHVCKLCEKTILRRDHHCFFMTVCIGYHNHKHFIFFCFYMMVGALYAVVLTAKFLHVAYGYKFYGPQTFFFLLLQIYDNVYNKHMTPTLLFSLLVFVLYVSLIVGLLAAGFLYWHVIITVNGQTTHDAMHGVRRYNNGFFRNFREVFGRFWPALLFLPLPLPQESDGRHYAAAASPSSSSPASSTSSSSSSTRSSSNVSARRKGKGVQKSKASISDRDSKNLSKTKKTSGAKPKSIAGRQCSLQ